MKYIDAEKLIAEIEAEIERKRDSALERQKNLEKIGQETVLNEMIAFELNRLISFVASLQQEMELPEKYQTPDWLFEGQEQPVEGYNRAMLEVKAKIDKLYDETSIGLNEYDAGLYNGIAETCMKLRGFIKARISSPEQSVLPGIDEEGIPGRDFIPVEWVDACERYGKWKIVRVEQPDGLEEAAEESWADYEYREHPQGLYASCYQDGFIAGAEWQKSKMMEEAIERVVKVDAGGYPYIDATELYDYEKDKPLAKAGDKVRVIVIKEGGK